MKPAAIELHIGRVVWHGAGAPSAELLAVAIEAALTRALAGEPRPPGATAAGGAGEAIAAGVLPSLPGGPR
jgi:hypothetical protein